MTRDARPLARTDVLAVAAVVLVATTADAAVVRHGGGLGEAMQTTVCIGPQRAGRGQMLGPLVVLRHVGLAAAKIGYLYGPEGREYAWVYGHGSFGRRAAITVTRWGALLLMSLPALCVTAALGVARAPSPAPPALAAIAAVVVATTALHVVSFGGSRFHLPLVPLLAVVAMTLAALAIAWSGSGRTCVPP